SAVTGTVLPPEPCPSLSNTITTHAVTAVASLHVPEGWSQGSVVGDIVRDAAALVTFRAISGLPAPSLGDHFPWTKVVDLRITKGIRTAGRVWTVFADVRNLFNFQNEIARFASTNAVQDPLFEIGVLSPELSNMNNEAFNNNALRSDGALVLNNCAAWSGTAGPVNCVMLARAEARFGNGDGVYTVAEQTHALTSWYDSMFGSWRFFGPQRTIRMGLELAF
ncbi:MAG TPA: hypothetical protein VNG95_05975, partial [Gemmatimonadales bacterium]|nr:hypothetical protein [Gemmatimonadales bacterium]